MSEAVVRLAEAVAEVVDGGFYPAPFIAAHCPFMGPLRETPEFARTVAEAERRVAEFSVRSDRPAATASARLTPEVAE